MSKPWVKDRDIALWGGCGALLVGAVLLHDAFENRGIGKPFWLKFLPAG